MIAREVLGELDRLSISIFYDPRRPDAEIGVGIGRERAHPEFLLAIAARTPELLREARFEASRHTPGIFLRKLEGAA